MNTNKRLQAAEERLWRVVPGFRTDRNESWDIYLDSEDRMTIRGLRAKILSLTENLDTAKKSLKDLNKAGTSLTNPILVELKQNIKEITETIVNLIDAELPRLTQLKQIGLENSRASIENLLNPRKRSRADATDDGVSSQGIQFVPYDYMPRDTIPEQPKPSFIMKAPDASIDPLIGESQPFYSVVSSDESESSEEDESENVDRYLSGVDSMYQSIMLEMKPLIVKYDCRDAVLKVLRSYYWRDARRLALNATISMAEEFRKMPQGQSL